MRVENLIIGAGITGLSCAYHLEKLSKKYEKRNKHSSRCNYLILNNGREIGGLARSKEIGGFIFDYSAHLLHCKSSYFYNWLKENLGSEIVLHKRNAWIYSHGVFTKYPFQANLYGLPKNVVKECLEGLLNPDRLKKYEKNSFERWCYEKFGSGISKHFMLPYNRKFWTLDTKKLSDEWIDEFIPQPAIRDVLDGTFEYGHKEFGYHSKFFYPRKGGVEVFVKKLASFCRNIMLDEDVVAINIEEKWAETKKGKKFYYKNLISTVPLVQLKDLIVDMSRQIKGEFLKLRHISVINVNLGVKRKSISNKDWIYFPEDNYIFYRIGFPMNFAPTSTPREFSSIYIDISYSDWKFLEYNKEDLIEIVRADLIKIGIIDDVDEIPIVDINDIKYAYIVYDKKWAQSRGDIVGYLNKKSIYPAGRFGAWKYLSMEGCFLEGKRVAEHLISG
ncbi:MAG: FAD-dependent oxidoreductase [Candidatus Saelkia tenebricola]|nr:FAD-dependent oxidoreductase [Candidatus Saelkia tenebricola]